MKETILQNLENPGQLEKLYRDNKAAFKSAFNLAYPDMQEHPVAQVWHERLNFEGDEIAWGSRNTLMFVIAASLIAGLIAKIPAFTAIGVDFFYPRNLSFVVFPLLAIYFLRQQHFQLKRVAVVSASMLISVIYINLLPDDSHSDTLTLACIHLPLFLWALLGYAFAGGQLNDYRKRIDYLSYNGDLLVMTTIILLAGALLTGITLGLFSMIGLSIEVFYMDYIVIWGLAASPIVGTYLVQTNPQLVSKVSPVIAKIFTPLLLVTLLVYLGAVALTGRDPYNDRDFLLIFNLLLIAVMAIILFSVAETSRYKGNKTGTLLLFALSVVTIVVNGIALSAILFRISTWGITPNRLAVLGSNLLILINLIWVTYRLFKTIRQPGEIESVKRSIAAFLPVYWGWTLIVTFLFPVLFNFR
jgi:hypothetical protein